MTLTRLLTLFAAAFGTLLAQAPSGPGMPRPNAPGSAVRRLENGLLAIGTMRIDLARREVTVPATTNAATLLEFVANTRNGFKAYESALTVDCNATSFNAAMLLIGLDPGHARVPTRHFDPVAPTGDLIELFMEWTADGERRHLPVEQLLFDRRTNAPIPEGPWVYTGSTFLRDGVNPVRYMAEMDGVLIGFVHSPAPVIENPRAGGVNAYGSVIFNENVGLKPGTPVTLTIRALP